MVCGGLRWFVVDCGGLSFSHTGASRFRRDADVALAVADVSFSSFTSKGSSHSD